MNVDRYRFDWHLKGRLSLFGHVHSFQGEPMEIFDVAASVITIAMFLVTVIQLIKIWMER
ncbi:hypothetical protein DUT91_23940 [Phyllobacterium salinisoli]|uniref:Uncharacterized protein n=1 Tax=Phyllobacterium salinisoli TaxID=1899321 RepID=A0A368JZ80_9HYPH|nr:hypothetical protein DUT91_23940 [Phyllobacterium salinisoli]